MAVSLSDVLTAVQNGVTAANNLIVQVKGSFNNIAGQLATLTAQVTTISSAYVPSIAGNSGAFTLNAATGITNTVNDIELSQASSSQFGAVKVDGTTIAATSGVISTVQPLPSQITTALSSDVLLNNIANYFSGPSIAQGATGTWFAIGTVTMVDTAGAGGFFCRLWDGTTVIDSGWVSSAAANFAASMTLSGYITSPSSNIKISCRDTASTSGKIISNATGDSKDSKISAYRIG